MNNDFILNLKTIYLLYDKFENRFSMISMSDSYNSAITQFVEYILNSKLPPNRFTVYQIVPDDIKLESFDNSSSDIVENYNLISSFRNNQLAEFNLMMAKRKSELMKAEDNLNDLFSKSNFKGDIDK